MGRPGPRTVRPRSRRPPFSLSRYLLETFFPDAYNGTYVELGALDGQAFSNTAALHTAFGWRGLMIEASPDMYAKLTVNRTGDVCVNAAICDESRMVHYVSASEPNGDGVRGIWEFMHESFRARWHPNANIDAQPLVPCLPLADVFDALGVLHVNFFSLDVEGAELAVLRTVDFARVTFDVICVEADGANEAKDAAVVAMLEGAGYRLVRQGGGFPVNDWFVSERFDRGINS